ncbi:MAG TPA: glycosyltransferase family A protein [Bryobacteraceae bacterium]|nr:glycosyltransferase family A protein [Bryobacteraceae bacterium]
MPTAGRPEFVAQSLLSFERQTYTNAELIVVDSGLHPVGDLCRRFHRVRHIDVVRSTSLGEKLNVGVAASEGAIIQKWDDDDYHHPDFLRTAVQTLRSQAVSRPAAVVWDCFLVLLAGERFLRHSGCGWRTGATLCFDRQLWNTQPFRPLQRSEDSRFVADHASRVVSICAPESYIVVRHGRNTWTSMEDRSDVDEYFWSLPPYPKRIEDVVVPEQASFYRSLTAEPWHSWSQQF